MKCIIRDRRSVDQCSMRGKKDIKAGKKGLELDRTRTYIHTYIHMYNGYERYLHIIVVIITSTY